MTVDRQITEDLAIVADISRARPRPLEQTLRVAGAMRHPPERVEPVGAALELSRIFVARIARSAAGLTMTAATLALFAWATLPSAYGDPGVPDDLLYLSKLWPAVVILGIAAFAYAVAAHFAARAFLRAGHPYRLRRAARWATATTVVGITTFVVFFGLMQVVLGGFALHSMRDAGLGIPGVETSAIRTSTIAMVLPAFVACGLAAFVAHIQLPRGAWLVALVGLLATIVTGLAYDVGPLIIYLDIDHGPHGPVLPSIALRGVLTATGTLSLVGLVVALVQAWQRREDRRLAQYSS